MTGQRRVLGQRAKVEAAIDAAGRVTARAARKVNVEIALACDVSPGYVSRIRRLMRQRERYADPDVRAQRAEWARETYQRRQDGTLTPCPARGDRIGTRRIGRPSAAPPLLGLTYERVAEIVEGRVNVQTSRAARRWCRGLADMGAVRAVRLADAAGLDLGQLVRELARRIREQRGEE